MINATVETKIEIIKYLEHLGNHPYAMPIDKIGGLCQALQDKFDLAYSELHSYHESWPEYSGYAAFPIGSSSQNALNKYKAPFWSTSAYGKARRRLCLHIAAELRKEIDYHA